MILFNSIFPKGFPLKDLIVYPNKVKFAKLGNSLLYDTQENIIYRDPNSSISYSNTNLKVTGEIAIPDISAYQSWARLGYSGNLYEQKNITDYQVEYSVNTECEGFKLNPSNGYVTCTNNITTNSKTFKVNVKLTMALSGSVVTETITFNQNAGVKTTSYSSWETKSLIVSASPSNISAEGGDSKITTKAVQQRELYTYWNGVHTDTTPETRQITVNPTYSIVGEGFSMKDDIVTAENRGVIPGDARTATITAYYENVEETCTCTQDANEETTITYGTLDVVFEYPEKDASEGSVNPILSYSQSCYQNYTSKDKKPLLPITTGATINYSESDNRGHADAVVDQSTGIVTWKANTSDKSRNCEVSATVTLNNFGVMTAATSTQLEDAIKQYIYEIPEVSLTVPDIPARGGTVSEGKVSYSQLRRNIYISGKDTTTTLKSGGDVSYSPAVSADNLERNETIRTKVGTLTATVEMNGKTGSTTVDVYQEANVKTITEVRGGEITYGDVIPGEITNYIIPASGGDGKATAADGYQEWNKSKTITYYSYTSKLDDSEITEGASSGKNSIKPDYETLEATGIRLMNNIKNEEILKSRLVTWSGNNNKSATGTMYVYQEGNYVTELTLLYGGSVRYDDFDAGGNSLNPYSTNATVKYTFTSGYSTSIASIAPSSDYGTLTRQISYSMTPAEGFTLNSSSTGQITTTNNTSPSERSTDVTRTEIVTWKHNDTYYRGGSVSSDPVDSSCTITQKAGKIEEVTELVTEEIIINPVGIIPPNGKTVNLTTQAKQYKYHYTYVNGVIDDTLTRKDPNPSYKNITPTYTVTGDGFSIVNNTQLKVESRGSEPSDNVRSGIVTATYEGKTDQLIVTQAANGKVKVVKDAIGSFTYYPVSNEGCKKKAIDEMNIELLIEENYLSGEYVNNSRPQPVPITNVDQLQEFLTYYDPVTQTAPVDYWFGIVEPCLEYDETGHGFDVCEVWDQTGAIDWAKNTTGQNRQAKIGLFACTGVENGVRKYECVLESTTIQQEIITYKISNVSLNFTAAEDNITPTIECTKYIDGVPQNETFELTDYILTKVEGSDGFTTDGKKIIVSANTGIERSAKFNISVGTNTINPEYYEIGTLTCIQDEDSIDHYIHDISISAYPKSIEASGGSSTITANCKEYKIWVSGKQIESTSTPKLSKSESDSGFTLNGTTLTASKNTSESDRSCTITATCGGESASCTVIQKGFTDYITIYGTPTISIGEGMTAKGGKATVTASVINTYASGITKEGTVTLEITSNGNNRFSLSGNTLRHGNMGATTSESVKVTAYNADNRSKKASATKDITNSVAYSTVTKIDLSEFTYPTASNLSNSSVEPNIGTVTISLQDTYQSGYTSTTYSVSDVTAYTKEFTIDSTDYFTIDTNGKCTTRFRNDYSSIRSTEVTLTIGLTGGYQGTKIASFKTTVQQAATTSYKATIYYTPPSGSCWIITDSTIEPTCGTGPAEYGSYQTLSFKPGDSLTVNDYQGNIGKVAIGSEAYVYVYVDGQWNYVGRFTHRNENYTVQI